MGESQRPEMAESQRPDPGEPKSVEERLAEIEAKLSFSEDLLETLNTTIYRQQQHIDRLQQEMRALRETMENASPAEPMRPGDEVPPHY